MHRCVAQGCHEVHLQPEREIADFIEQQSAPARASSAPCAGAGALSSAAVRSPNSRMLNSFSSESMQETTTKGFSRRGLAAWMARARSSFPVPFSPVSSTVASLLAARLASPRRSSMSWLRDTMFARQSPSTDVNVDAATARSTCPNSSAFSTGLIKKPNAPRCVACTASGIVPCAVMIITVKVGQRLFNSFRRSRPSMPPKRRSVITKIRARTHAGIQCGLAAVNPVHCVVCRSQANAEKTAGLGVIVDDEDTGFAVRFRVAFAVAVRGFRFRLNAESKRGCKRRRFVTHRMHPLHAQVSNGPSPLL